MADIKGLFCLRGPSATLNFPMNPPDISSPIDLSPSQIREAAFRHSRKGSETTASRSLSYRVYLPSKEQRVGSLDRIASGAYYQASGVWTV
uniref:Uncharacterized protein n=1 Tax=Manihot esculenta TaxID=3983 RepID=A0A2C9W4F3_MANES